MGAISGEEVKMLEKMQTAASAREEKILVLVRLRPLNEKEITASEVADWECLNETTILYRNTLREGSTFPSAYTFDKVFRGECSTKQVYEEGAKEIALSVVSGINSSIFAYGQTSSGKTHTMNGITEYTVADIFDYIHKHEERAFAIKLSAIEIYNEAIRDLLSSEGTQLRLRDDPEKGTIVEKATEETLRDWSHLKDLLSVCEAQRRIGETSLNEKSSRSHQIIKLTIESSAREFLGKGNSTTLVASVNFIDLAGSERASQALSGGTRLKEGCHINRSLLTLGTVIRKLSNGRHGHINYRDSKLTRILQPCLGGNARTAIVCTLSPARSHVEQTRNTLLFACCAKEVTTKAQVNVVMSDKALVKQLQKELARLESEMRNHAPPTSLTYDYAGLLRKKDLQIQKMESEIREVTKQRDLAQSRLEDLLRMVGHDQTPKAQKMNRWEDEFSVSESSGVAYSPYLENGEINSYTSDASTPMSNNKRFVRSSSVDSLARTTEDTEEYCKEVQCIEIEESNHNGRNEELMPPLTQNESRSHVPYPDDEQYLAPDISSSSSRGFKLTRSWSCREDLMTGSSTPTSVWERNFPGRPESLQRKLFTPTHYDSNISKMSRNDSLSSRESESTDDIRAHGGDITSIHTFVAGLKDMAKNHVQVKDAGPDANGVNDKIVKDVGLDAMVVNWPQEFERQQLEILELWQTCNTSLVHRTYFYLLFKGDPADSIYMEVELRRLSFLKENFSQGTQATEGGQTLTFAESSKALRHEKQMLSKLLGKRFSEEERRTLYENWDIDLDSKQRRLQLANLLWTNPKDKKHVADSAAIVAKLIRFVEQGKALKEMFGLSFTPPRVTRRSYSWKASLF